MYEFIKSAISDDEFNNFEITDMYPNDYQEGYVVDLMEEYGASDFDELLDMIASWGNMSLGVDDDILLTLK